MNAVALPERSTATTQFRLPLPLHETKSVRVPRSELRSHLLQYILRQERIRRIGLPTAEPIVH